MTQVKLIVKIMVIQVIVVIVIFTEIAAKRKANKSEAKIG